MWRRLQPAGSRLVSTGVPMSRDAAGKSACATLWLIHFPRRNLDAGMSSGGQKTRLGALAPFDRLEHRYRIARNKFKGKESAETSLGAADTSVCATTKPCDTIDPPRWRV